MDIPSFLIGLRMNTNTSDVCYVTFKSNDGTVQLGKKAVAVGDDCASTAELIERGFLAGTPTKESSVAKDYIFDGWSKSAYGALSDSEALSNVDKDRSVYAVFKSVDRKYTVTYLDTDGTVLKTESVAYGATPPSYAPEKEGYQFDGWNPAVTTVTGDVSYKAVWSTMLTFANATWEQIIEISEAGNAQQYFAVGDEKTITFNGSPLTLVVAGFDHDDLTDGSGKAGMSIICKTLPDKTVAYASADNSNSVYGKSSNTLHTALQGTFKSLLPAELRTAIKQVNKACDASSSSGVETPRLVACYLWPLSHAELNSEKNITNNTSNYTNNISTLGAAYALFPTTQVGYAFKRTIANTSTAGTWWLRQQNRVGVCRPVYAKTDGLLTSDTKYTTERYVLFGFCI